MSKTLKVRAVDDRRLSFVDADGVLVQGRFVGVDRKGNARDEEVPATSYYHRAIARGDIALAEENDQ